MNQSINIEKLILELVLADNYQPLKPKAIAKKLELLEDEKKVRRTIRKLVQAGRISFGDKHQVIKPKLKNKGGKAKSSLKEPAFGEGVFPADSDPFPLHSKSKSKNKPKSAKAEKPAKTTEKKKKNHVVGVFRRNQAGFGFVTPLDSTVTDRSEDIFIPRSKTLDAADRDTVEVRISKPRPGDRPDRMSGRILDVVERHTHRFVGTYRESGNYGVVSIDGGGFDSAILVGDAGAKNCRVEDKVVVEMVHFPTANEPGEGVVVEVLGARGEPGVDTKMVIHEFGLPEEFPEEVLDDARDQAEKFDESIEGRTDFTKQTVITIDPKTARDFDDAISLKRLENGHWELGVHIADVSHFVPYRSKLDTEAYLRGTSVYLPDQVIPMLPEIISNNLASLQPDRVRYCMTAVIEFSDSGVPINTQLHRGAIKSAHRFNYEEIDDYLENDEPWKEKLAPDVFRIVRDMHTLAMTLRNRRMDAGAIDLILPEVKIDLDDDGDVSGAHTVQNTESHQVIEEFMLAANEAVARRLADEKLYLMRRVHPKPTEAKLADLTKFVRELGIECDNLESRHELKRVIAESADMPQRHAIHFAVLRAFQKAIYSPEEIGHFALNSENYCHFTSPIRRYPDLIIHRMVGDLVDGKKPKSNYDTLATLGKHCSELEKRATEAERELIKLKLLSFMSKRIGETLDAIITGVESFGIFVQGVEIPAEGMLPVENLPPDSYEYDRTSRVMSGFEEPNQFRLGDTIRVKVSKVDLDQRLLEYEIADRASGKSVMRRGPARRSSRTSSNAKVDPKNKGARTTKDKSRIKAKSKSTSTKTKSGKRKKKKRRK
jgi:ribonuclease R